MTHLPTDDNNIDDYEPSNEDYINRIKYDDDPKVRANAVFVLGRLNAIEALPTMIEALENDKSHEVRLTVVEILGKFRVPDVIPPLLKTLESDDDDMRAQASKSLGLVGRISVLDSLVNALGDQSAQVRAEAAEALGELKAVGAVDVLVNTLVADEDSHVRFFAIQSLVRIGGDTVRDALVTRLQKEKNEGVLIDLIETIAKLKDPSTIEPLRIFSEHDDADVKLVAEWAIGVLEKL